MRPYGQQPTRLLCPQNSPGKNTLMGCHVLLRSFHLGCHRSAVSLLDLNVSPLTQTIALLWGLDTCFGSPTHWGQVQSYECSCFAPSSFILLSFAWFYIFFSTGQVVLCTLRWCSACTSVSEGVFLMYPWREIIPLPPTPLPSCSPLVCWPLSNLFCEVTTQLFDV